MVERRVTDGKRIAQLLASELTGHATDPLDAVAVVDAEPDATADPEGTFAYGIAFDGRRVGAVYVESDRAQLVLRAAVETAESAATDAGLAVDSSAASAGERAVLVESGAAVKRALDVVVATVAEIEARENGRP